MPTPDEHDRNIGRRDMDKPIGKIIEFKMPLWGVVTTIGAVLFSVGGLYTKMDTLVIAVGEIRSDAKSAENRYSDLKIDVRTESAQVKQNTQDIARLYVKTDELEKAVNAAKQGQRWMPK